MENVNALAFATELSKKFREASDTLRANGIDPTKDGVTLSYGAMLALCDSIEQLERERDAALMDADKSYHAAKEATDSYYVMLRERDEAQQERDGLSIMLTSAESAFETMKRERDAAVKDISRICEYCKYSDQPYGVEPCPLIEEYYEIEGCSNWQWRGVEVE